MKLSNSWLQCDLQCLLSVALTVQSCVTALTCTSHDPRTTETYLSDIVTGACSPLSQCMNYHNSLCGFYRLLNIAALH